MKTIHNEVRFGPLQCRAHQSTIDFVGHRLYYCLSNGLRCCWRKYTTGISCVRTRIMRGSLAEDPPKQRLALGSTRNRIPRAPQTHAFTPLKRGKKTRTSRTDAKTRTADDERKLKPSSIPVVAESRERRISRALQTDLARDVVDIHTYV